VKVGDAVTLTVVGVGQAGEGVARAPSGLTLFVPGALPGEKLLATVTELHASWGRARLDELLTRSPDRVTPPCPVFGRCGGCAFQHWSYAAELEHKASRVASALTRIGGLGDTVVNPVVPASATYAYRAKGSFAFGGRAGALELGFYAARTHRLVAFDHCAIQAPLVNRVVGVAATLANDFGWAPYDESTGHGLLRHLVVRASRAEGRVAAMVVVTRHEPGLAQWAERLMAAVPELVGVAENLNAEATNRIQGRVTRTLAGDPVLHEEILGGKFAVAPDAFFQVNPAQVETLYQLALDALGPGNLETALDLYAGVGTLAVLLARRVRQVVAVELSAAAVAEGRANTAGLSVVFHQGAAERVMRQLVAEGYRPDAVVMDPPRTGARPEVLEALMAAAPARIAYISCRPETLARDLAVLARDYHVDGVTPVDMFPQSDHVEAVAALSRIRNGSALP